MNHSLLIRRRLDSRGVGSMEFAFFAMAGLGVLLCGMDVVNYARARLKIDEVSSSLASIVSDYQQIYANDFPVLYQISQQAADVWDVTQTGGNTIFTGITNTNGTPVVAWRDFKNSYFTSNLGSVGSTVTKLPDNYLVPIGSSVIAVEVFSSVRPWFFSQTIMGTGSQPALGSLTMFQSRSALLSKITPGNRP